MLKKDEKLSNRPGRNRRMEERDQLGLRKSSSSQYHEFNEGENEGERGKGDVDFVSRGGKKEERRDISFSYGGTLNHPARGSDGERKRSKKAMSRKKTGGRKTGRVTFVRRGGGGAWEIPPTDRRERC